MLNEPVIDALLDDIRRISRLESALSLLSWDQETEMPRGGAASRARVRGELTEVIHRMWQAPELGDRLARAEEKARGNGDSRAARLVRVVRREYDLKSRVPSALAEEIARVTSEAQNVWQEARGESRFETFQPILERVIDLKRREADALRTGDELRYDALLLKYEPGWKAARIQELGEAIKPVLIDLVARYAPVCAEVPVAFLRREFPTGEQACFGRDVLADLGYDLDRGAIAVSTHPFCSGISAPSDVRVTTRYQEDDLRVALFSLLHECGHALYEQGFDPDWEHTPVAEAQSMGLHESQSRLWENQIGLSRPFWVHYLPHLKERFPEPLAGIEIDDFLRAVNRVEPSMIRVEADEVTYNLHVLLRFELERELIEGEIRVADLPRLWDQRMEEYLGVRPENDAEGVLQDIHWSMGAIGYFPTYFLGNLYAAQIFAAAGRAIPDLAARVGSGEFQTLRLWLRDQVHRLGSIYDAEEICEKATGAPLDTEPFVDYLRTKLADLYGPRT